MRQVKIEKKSSLDGFSRRKEKEISYDYPLAQYVLKNKNSSQLFSKRRRILDFTTNDSKLYFTQSELLRLRKGEKVFRPGFRIDCAIGRKEVFKKKFTLQQKTDVYFSLKERYSSFGNYISDLLTGSVRGMSLSRAWNVSLIGSIIFGMFLMTMIYRYLGQGAAARTREAKVAEIQTAEIRMPEPVKEETQLSEDDYAAKLLEEYKNKAQEEIEQRMMEMVKGYPIEKMVPEIAKKDRTVAAFIIAIAKKESNWGKRVPVLNGEDCYNYWGYRGIRDRMGTGGHTCFNDRKDAVDTVAKRIGFLVSERNLNTPAKMVIWKCGSDCNVTGGQAAANKWISDVDMYFRKLDSAGKQ